MKEKSKDPTAVPSVKIDRAKKFSRQTANSYGKDNVQKRHVANERTAGDLESERLQGVKGGLKDE